MRHDVDARLAAIAAEVERRRLIQEEPIDPLSASLYSMARELRGLDETGREALKNELELTEEQFECFIASYSKF